MKARSAKAIKNVIASMIFKGGSILISLILVPMTLSYLNPYEYGIWLTLSSVLTWVYIFDIGLGNGLRNKLTEALALNDLKLAKIYVSTSFFSLLILVTTIYLLFILVQSWMNWELILNVDAQKVQNLSYIVIIVFTFFCASFVLRLIGNIYMAYQQPAINDLLSLMANIVSLVLIYLCTIFTEGSLEKVAIIYSAAPVLIFLLAYPVTFWKLKEISPSVYWVRFGYLRELMSLGIQFFIIQMACLILFMTSNLVISQMFGPESVTPYNIAFKYFSLVNTGFTIIINPIWSAITDAYVNKDLIWIRKAMKKLVLIWLGGIVLTMIMVLMSTNVYKVWIGEDIHIPFVLSVLCGFYVSIANWNNIFAYFINGVGKVRLQLYSSIISGVIFFPLAFYFGSVWEIAGILLALCVCLLPSAVWAPIQYWKIINCKATGIWFK
ncbi:lipopolysaccharide biosynthesis protein [Bacteroides sp. AM10-21B]|uniref:lipopolysaccharide biosynthesis protein n=1 Tax=Bacteroides sp. AM10-21B TaxID=2292001 RepID=UPI001F1F6AC4|nr:oligosaccharide flippase family protein [Bacteroides sp. AM10-21B]